MAIPVITVDGPTASGKGTASRGIAKALGWSLLDSGALYRVLAYAALDAGVPLDAPERLAALAADLDIEFVQDNGHVILGGKDVTDAIRAESHGNETSKISGFPEVRKALFKRQQGFRQAPGLVADGRDMGTVVFADAKLKFYLTASAEVRAQRRLRELQQKGADVTLAGLTQEIRERDIRDKERKVSPLLPADEAVVIDTSELGIDDVMSQVMAEVKRVFPV